MLVYSIGLVVIGAINLIFGFVQLPDFGLTTTFSSYISWFYTFIDSVTSLIAFLIPRPVFLASISIFIIVHEFDQFIALFKMIYNLIPIPGSIFR